MEVTPNMKKALLSLLLLHTQLSGTFPVSPKSLEEKKMEIVQSYLENFYDMPKSGSKIKRHKNSTQLVKKLKEMQKFFGLEETGQPDEETMEIMEIPRCGVPDVSEYKLTEGNPKWQKNEITYSIITYTTDMAKADVDSAIAKAINIWSGPSPLKFTRINNGEADIKISFARRGHGDNSPFDGENGVLAHAYQPGQGIGGDAHFDEDETWTMSSRGYNLFLVAAHEFGHSLGLSHSTDPGALMFPTYSFSEPSTYALPQDDINGIQFLYGRSSNPINPTGPTTPGTCDPQLTFDAITTLRGELIAFKDKYFWRKHPQLPRPELHTISLFWPSLPSGIQAAYEDVENDLVFLFKGNQYWTLHGYEIRSGFPQDISNFGFPRTVQAIDAAVSYSDYKKTYFFVKNQYWRYDNQRHAMDPGYPKNIADKFQGLTNTVDAVFQKNNYFYFFSGPTYYKFDLRTKRIVAIGRSNRLLNCR
ncbi:neutrophil collagenase-like [Dromiciops gliroides]|uniref:neutrophil collagenase-like n=1 Tax=Dromiciops gliroides TaxID=33562 RepID=UPI001CC75907|nr:neutrophil collagenase-like [Dromiciops gliroides]